MRILLDECLPVDFRHHLPGHDAHTVQWAGWKGKKNGELLRAAEEAGYEVFLTIDQGIPFQNSAKGRRIAIVMLQARTNQLVDLLPLLDGLLLSLNDVRAGQILRVGPAQD
jgi:hypothetical protein